jgi:hypothetical protein
VAVWEGTKKSEIADEDVFRYDYVLRHKQTGPSANFESRFRSLRTSSYQEAFVNVALRQRLDYDVSSVGRKIGRSPSCST